MPTLYMNLYFFAKAIYLFDEIFEVILFIGRSSQPHFITERRLPLNFTPKWCEMKEVPSFYSGTLRLRIKYMIHLQQC